MRGVAPAGLILGLLLALPSVPLQASTNPTRPPSIEVLAADERGVDLIFRLPELDLADVTLAGREFKSVEIPGGGVKGEVGAPAIPTFTRLVAVPEGVGVQVSAVPLEREELTGIHVAPLQKGDGSGVEYDEAAYRRAEAATEPDVLVSEPMILRDLRVVAVTFLPVHYDPAAGRLAVTRQMRVEVEFTGTDPAAARVVRHRTIPPSFDQLYQSLVVNYPGAEALGAGIAPGTYLIICPSDSAVTNRLSHLVTWRQRKGSPVVLATTAQTGTTNALIKNYIQNAYNTWTVPPEYVVLAGDATAPYAIPTWNETRSGYNGEGDHPYTLLAGGDILSDVHIGRLSFSSLDELLRIVNKSVHYETQPFVQDSTWFTRACGVGDPANSGPSTIECMQWMKTRLVNIGYTQVDTVFASPWVSQMSTAFNRGDTIIGYRGWLGMSGWSNANTYSLTNGWRMPFALIFTCGTGSFASESAARSEGFLRAGTGVDQPKGAVGAIGLATIGTHTRYNNCLFFGTLHGLLEDRLHSMGAAQSRGKLEMFLNYNDVQPNWVEIMSYWGNLMGDPAVDVWTAFPQPLAVAHPATIAVGANSAVMTVTQSGSPVTGAQVCLWKGQESYAVGYTDAQGRVELPINAATAGNMLLTVSKHNARPYLATIPVGQQSLFVGYSSSAIDDAAGSNDGLVNPGEAIGLRVQVRNTGTTTATAVSATLSTTDPYVTMVDGYETFPNIAAGGTTWTNDDFDFNVSRDCPHGRVLRFSLDVTASENQYHSLIEIPVVSADLVAGAVTLYNAGPNGILDPGETVQMSVVLSNNGGMQATAVAGTLISLTSFVTVGDGSGTFGTIAAGGTGNNAGDRFTITAAPNTYRGFLANFMLVTDFSGGVTDTTFVAVTVSQRATTDPIGPDLYGYYAFDNTDTSYPEAPAYNWIELDPALGGDGVEVVLGDFGDTQDKSRIIDIPFPFQYYGRTYTRATVCSNGWLAMGETYLTSYRNWTIPGAGGPAAMMAVFWDELYQVSGTSRCFQKYDVANNRWIVEWSRFRNLVGNGTETFEVILYDPAYHRTDTGDGIIVFQYHTVVNPDGTDGYCTVGIEDHNQTDGLLYTYFNRYPLGAATLAAGRAIRFVPVLDRRLGTLSGVTRNSFNNGPVQGVQVNVIGSGRTFFSGADGAYGGFVPQGTYDIIASHPSFAPDTAYAVVITESTETIVNFLLDDVAGPAITTTPHPHTSNEIGPYPIVAQIVEYSGLPEKTLYYKTNGGPFSALPLVPTGGDTYVAAIPGQPYSTLVSYYVYARDGIGNQSVDPPGAPNATYSFWVSPMEVVLDDTFEADRGWSVGAPDDNATSGIWIRAEPVGTWQGSVPVQPDFDHTPDPGELCFVTGNGNPGDPPGNNDVDGGKTTLFSPVFDLDSYATATVSYWVWYTNDLGNAPGEDYWVVDVTSDGSTWVSLENTTQSTNNWVARSFILDSYVPLTSTVQLRFVASDYGAGSLVEAAVDDFTLTGLRVPLGLAAPDVLLTNGLDPCRPNPFNPQTTITYRVAEPGPATLKIYDVAGRLVRTLVDGAVAAGEQTVTWDGRNGAGAAVSSGIYFMRLETGDFMQVRQMTLLR